MPWDQALPGDLVGYDGHITVYLGVIDGRRMQLESPQSGDYIKVSGVRQRRRFRRPPLVDPMTNRFAAVSPCCETRSGSTFSSRGRIFDATADH